jgi:hypothetical protein
MSIIEIRENGKVAETLEDKALHTAITNYSKLKKQEQELKQQIAQQREVIEEKAFDFLSKDRKSATLSVDEIELTVNFTTKYKIQDAEALRETIPEEIFSTYISTKYQTKSGFSTYIKSHPELIIDKIITQELPKPTIKLK